MIRPRGETLLTRAEVAALFGVHPHSVTRWADAGRLTVIKTPGGHRRYLRDEVDRLLLVRTRPAASAQATTT